MQAASEHSLQRKSRSLLTFSSLHRHVVPFLLLAFSILYFADVLLRAWEKYFWYDEIYTVYISRLSVSGISQALKRAVDLNPPLFYWLTKASEAITGENQITVRLPEVIGFWIFCLCLFRFVSRRAGVVAGFIAMVFPVLTGAFFYAYDARPHGIVLGFVGLSIVCWQKAYQSERRGLWMILLSLSIFGAVMNHCFAVLLAFPFAMAELFETIKSRRLHADFWAALTLPLLAVVPIYLPLLRGNQKGVSGTDFGQFTPDWFQVQHFYHFLLDPSFLLLLFALLLIFAARINAPAFWPIVPGREIVLALGFLALPAVGVLVAKAGSAAYYDRYFISALIGVCLSLAIPFASRSTRGHAIATVFAVVLVSCLCVDLGNVVWDRFHHRGVVLFEPSGSSQLNTTPRNPIANESLLLSAKEEVPIGIRMNLQFLYIAYYAPSISRRVYYLADSKTDQVYRALQTLVGWGPPYNRPQVFSEFVKAHGRFYLFGGQEILDDLSDLTAEGWRLRSLQTFQGENLALIDSGGNPLSN